jgi:hypothetical protein
MKTVIGQNELISIGNRATNIPAKIDTGADSSAIWASKIRVGKDGVLRFALFGEGSPHFTGKIYKRTDFKVASIKNSFGHNEIRYRTHFLVKLSGKKIKMLMTLADRSKNTFKILIGRRSIAHKFLVDVTKKTVTLPKPTKTAALNKQLAKSPYKFHKKYVKKVSS